jgi:chemotaxis protein CheD
VIEITDEKLNEKSNSKTDSTTLSTGLPISQEYVKLGQIIFTKTPEHYNLLGIGTCLSIFMYDLKRGNYCFSHCMLPEFMECDRNSPSMPGRYTDLAVDYMLNKMLNEGSNRADIKVKIVGGAQIYTDTFRIGERNIEVARNKLKECGLKIIAEDVGGKKGRSITIYNRDGTINIRNNETNKFVI